MYEIYTWSSDHVDESESPRVLRFRLVLGEDARALRSESKVDTSTRRISTENVFGIDREPIELEWNILQDLLHWRPSRRSKKT